MERCRRSSFQARKSFQKTVRISSRFAYGVVPISILVFKTGGGVSKPHNLIPKRSAILETNSLCSVGQARCHSNKNLSNESPESDMYCTDSHRCGSASKSGSKL